MAPKEGGIKLHTDQRVFMRAGTRFFSEHGCFNRGYGKCVAGDTILFTSDGQREIGSYFNYQNDDRESVYDQNIEVINRNGKCVVSSRGIYSGYKPTKKIQTKEGFSLECTYVHPVLMMDKDGQLRFRKSAELKIGDRIVISRNNNLFGDNVEIDHNDQLIRWTEQLSRQKKSHLNIRSMPKVLTSDFAYIIGLLIGDGCLTRENIIGFTNADNDIVQKYCDYMSRTFGSKIRKSNKYDYIISDVYLRKYLNLLGLEICDAHGKQIPSCILRSTKEIQKQFLRGLFDTDGGVEQNIISYCTVSKRLVTQVQTMLLNFGIVSRIRKKEYKNFYHYILVISGYDISVFEREIGFGCNRKSGRLAELSSKKHNTNNDTIPFQKEYVKQFYDDIKRYNPYLYGKISHIISERNSLSYEKLNMLLSLNKVDCSSVCSHFKELQDCNYYFAEISEIVDGMNHVYDLEVPDTHSFVSNGFVSHNTFLEFANMVIVCIRYPNIELALTAQTKENAAALLKDKYNELIRYYPMLQNEVAKTSFIKGDALIVFKNGARIDALANAQSSKGQRRKRISIEESNLMDNVVFEDALEPVVEVGRTTSGRLAVVNPEEMNQQINFYTTPGFRGSDEYNRNLSMFHDMRDLNGKIVLGSNWMLGCWYGRGSSKSAILKKKKDMSLIAFDMNYGGNWVGSSTGALVNINRLMNCRTLTAPELSLANADDEYYLGVDVARSQKKTNNQSSIAVGKVIRGTDGKITEIQLVNMIHMSNTLSFSTQAVMVKRVRKRYKARKIVVDGNGLGSGLIDELMKENFDPITGETYPSWDTINTTAEPEKPKSEVCLYDLKAQSCQTQILSNFIDVIDSGILRFLESRNGGDYAIKTNDDLNSKVMPFVQEELFFQEVGNLKLIQNGKNLTVEKVVSKFDKDRFSAAAYLLYFILKVEEADNRKSDVDIKSFAKRLQALNRRPKMY